MKLFMGISDSCRGYLGSERSCKFSPYCENPSGTDTWLATPAWLGGQCEVVLTQWEEHVCVQTACVRASECANVKFCTWTPHELGQTRRSPGLNCL